jgi:subtilisin-like proprotein convertase family protein
VGVSDEIEVPDVGIAQSLKIHVEIVNSKLSAVLVKLYDADDVEHILFAGGDVVGDTLIATYPNPDPQIAGDLTTWHGKNPKGTWRLVVIDDDFLNNQIDGEIVSWSVEMGTLSNQKVAVTGDLIVEGKVQGDLDTDGQVKAGGVQFKPSDAPPAPCSPVSEGTVYYDASVKSLRVCNGSEYLRLVMCSEACPDAADVSCGAPIENDCKELCGGEGVGLNTTQCLVNAATTPCAALVADNCANDCNLSGTSLDLDACADPANVTCGDVITDACGNACGTTGDKCDEVDTSCSGGSCVYQYHASCKEIQLAGGDQGSGNYVIDPDGPGGQAPMEVYCDMDGGWTLCASLTRGYVPSDMLYSKNTYAFRARKDGTNDFAYERDAPSRFSNTWEQSEALNYGQFCRLFGEAPNETRVEAKLYNQCNCSASGFKGKNYDQVRNGVYDGNLFLDWFSNDASGAFQKKSGDALTICSSNNGYGGPYATKSVGWSGGAGGECDNNVPYTQSTNPWGEAGGGCVGCTDSGGFYDKLAYGQVGILNDLSNPFWNGIPNVKYGWSDCSADGNCNYQESGYGVWLFWVR